MKIVRLGMTESSLIVLTYAVRLPFINKSIKTNISKFILNLVNWLYTTSGYYDKSVNGTKFNFSQTALNQNFIRYLSHLRESIQGCEEAQFIIHEGFVMSLFKEIKDQMIKELKIDNFRLLNDIPFTDRLPGIYEKMKNKKVLVVSSFDELIQQQYDSGNVFKLGIGFPIIKALNTVKTPYCFLNNGPHENYFETLDYIFDMIKQKDFDIAILGCGCYGHMLCHKIHSELNKDAVYVGGSITYTFGILATREKNHTNTKTNEYWITEIPDIYKPDNYKEIEDGCYW